MVGTTEPVKAVTPIYTIHQFIKKTNKIKRHKKEQRWLLALTEQGQVEMPGHKEQRVEIHPERQTPGHKRSQVPFEAPAWKAEGKGDIWETRKVQRSFIKQEWKSGSNHKPLRKKGPCSAVRDGPLGKSRTGSGDRRQAWAVAGGEAGARPRYRERSKNTGEAPPRKTAGGGTDFRTRINYCNNEKTKFKQTWKLKMKNGEKS